MYPCLWSGEWWQLCSGPLRESTWDSSRILNSNFKFYKVSLHKIGSLLHSSRQCESFPPLILMSMAISLANLIKTVSLLTLYPPWVPLTLTNQVWLFTWKLLDAKYFERYFIFSKWRSLSVGQQLFSWCNSNFYQTLKCKYWAIKVCVWALLCPLSTNIQKYIYKNTYCWVK